MTLNRPALALFFTVAALPGWAQSDDPPARVARLSYLSGSVAFRPGTVDDWSNATINYPLTSGDHLWTDPGARAEIHAGMAAIRMAPETALAILSLDDRTIQVSVSQGSVQIHVRSLDPDETIEVATPNVAVTLLRPGNYRIDADGENYVTKVTVRGGDAAVTGGGIAFPVHARQTARIRGQETVTEDVGAAIGVDEFEEWCESRERREEQSISANYVPRDMTGYQDLDDYGSWREEPQYGWVWSPRTVAEDWAPYRYGRWAWIEPWGWTWIDDAPWGYAPSHYGRWATIRGVWVWVPGRRSPGIRPVYAPALVVFVGGPRFGVSHAAWFPLGPFEVYRPTYRASDRYLRNVNVTHVTNINVTNVRYVNQRVGAVSAADNDTFVRSRHIGREAARVNATEVEQARVIGTAAHIPPRRESVIAGQVRNAPPARVVERTVVVRTAAPPRPVPFENRRRALEVNQGRPLDSTQVETLRRDAPARPPMVRTASPARNMPPRTESQPATESPRVFRPRTDEPRQAEPPRRIETPRVEPQRPVEQPRRVEQPRPIENRRVDPPRRPEPRTEQPRVEQPRVEQPRVEQPRVEPRRPDPPVRQVEQPRRPDPPARPVEQPRREEPRVERPAPTPPAEGSRQAQRERAEKQREERKAESKGERKKNEQ